MQWQTCMRHWESLTILPKNELNLHTSDYLIFLITLIRHKRLSLMISVLLIKLWQARSQGLNTTSIFHRIKEWTIFALVQLSKKRKTLRSPQKKNVGAKSEVKSAMKKITPLLTRNSLALGRIELRTTTQTLKLGLMVNNRPPRPCSMVKT